MNNSPTVFLAEASAPIRERLHVAFARARMHVIGEAAATATSIDQILQLRPDVVVLDVRLQGGTGLQVLKAVRSAAPGIAFVVFSHSSSSVYRRRYLREGACRFLDKNAELNELAQAVACARPTEQGGRCPTTAS